MKISFPLTEKIKISRRQKVFFIILLAILLVSIILIPVLQKRLIKSKIPLFFNENPAGNLIARNENAQNGKMKKNQHAFFTFNSEQKEELYKFYQENKSSSLILRLKFKSIPIKKLLETSQMEKPFFYGFLYESDFDEKKKFVGDIKNRILGNADERLFITIRENSKDNYVDLGIALKKDLKKEDFPEGFMIFTSYPVKLITAYFKESEIGFDLTREVPLISLPSNGGKIGDLFSIDFTGAQEVFSVSNTEKSIMPKILLQIDEAFQSSEENKGPFKINAGGEVLTIYQKPEKFNTQKEYTLQTCLLSKPFGIFTLSDHNIRLKKLLMVKNDENLIAGNLNPPLKPIITDPGLIPLSKRDNWRNTEYEIYEWESFPGILIFDIKDYNVQNDFFRRLAFYIEKAGYRGKILTDQELGDMHGYNAHDYSAKGLADFFTKTRDMTEILTESELLLRKILLANNIITRKQNGDYEEGKGAVISISQSSAEYLRKSLCAHEAWHGIYFTNEDFRNASAAIYYTIDPKAIDFLIGYWQSQSSLNYDPTDSYLIKNEFMAYVMQQGTKYTSSYFLKLANYASVQRAIPELADYIIKTKARALEDASYAFDSYARDQWGLSCGRVSLIDR